MMGLRPMYPVCVLETADVTRAHVRDSLALGARPSSVKGTQSGKTQRAPCLPYLFTRVKFQS
jgi:hypothetical protein